MKQIIKGASEYANGDLTYRIPVKSEDELGYLSNTLNYMADKINQNGEYQRTFIANVSHDFRSPLLPSRAMWKRFWMVPFRRRCRTNT